MDQKASGEDILCDLFTDRDYQAINFEYKDFRQKLFALKTSATDYDLTGQIIWKAADILSKFIIDYLGEAELKGKTVLELGSGPGLCALVTQHYASKVVLSDYQDLVMDLIAINMKDTEPQAKDTCQLLCTKLDWVKSSEPDYYSTLPIHAIDYSNLRGELMEVSKLGDMEFDVVIGSDIVYWTSSITPLMNVLTVSSLLSDSIQILFSRNSSSLKAFYFCYIERAVLTHKLLREGLFSAGIEEFGGFNVEEVGSDFAKSIDKDAYIYKVTKKS